MTATTRLVWIEFRRNVGIWFAPIIVLVAWFLLKETRVWVSFLWPDTNDLLPRVLIPFASPAIAGAAAWMAGRDRRRGIDDLVETTPMPEFARRLHLLAATALWAILAYLVFGGYMFGRTALQATADRPALWPVLIVMTALLAQASWGFLIGSL
ncbi:MAG TPA: hypothetical protein VNE17_08380, partial [Nitrolancea sp.]|nr:hypothetical protein [Nitrolancea sp.]